MKILYLPIVSYSMLPQSPHAYLDIFSQNGFDCYFMDSNHPAAEKHTHEPFSPQENFTVLPPNYDVNKIKPDILFISYPPHIHQVENFKPKNVMLVLYDFHDEGYHRELKKGIELADVIVSISHELYDFAIQLGADEDKLLYIPNGVYYDEFNKKHEMPNELKQINKPIIGYEGAISKHWVDINLLNKTADEYGVTFIGSVFDGDLSPNIYNLGHMERKELIQYIQHFDVGLIPFPRNKFAQHCDPLKYKEYLAAGIPTVSTPIPAVMETELAYVGDNFTNLINKALEENNRKLVNERKRFAKKLDWKTILKPLVNRLGEL